MVGLVNPRFGKRGYEENEEKRRKINIGIALAKIALQPRLNTIEDINASRWYLDYISACAPHKIPYYLTQDGIECLRENGFEDRYVRGGFHEQWREIPIDCSVTLDKSKLLKFDKKDFKRLLLDAILLSYREDLACLVGDLDRGY